MTGKKLSKQGGGLSPRLVRSGDAARLAEYGTRFLLALVLSGSRVFGELSPFAAAMTAASGGGVSGVASFMGAAAGYLLGGSLMWSVRYICVSALIMAAATAFRSTECVRRQWFMPMCAAAAAAAVGFVRLADSPDSAAAAAILLSDSVMCGGCAYFYAVALSPWSGRLDFERGEELTHTVSVLILVATLLTSVSRIEIFGFISPGRAAAMLLVFLAAYRGGLGAGCCFGVTLGLAMDAASGTVPFFSMAYALAGLVSGVFTKHGRLAFALSFIVTTAAAAAAGSGGDGVPAILYEVFIASVTFMALPQSLIARVGALLPGGEPGQGAARARESTKLRVDMTSLAFQDLYETVRGADVSDTNDSETAVVFDRAAESVCRQCENVGRCWTSNYEATQDVMNNIAPEMMRHGSIAEADFPPHFARSCVSLPELTQAINDEVRALLYRRQLKNRVHGSRSIAYNQYSDMSSILSDISTELGQDGGCEPELERRLVKYLTSAGIKADAAVFRGRGGRLRVEISGGDTGRLMRDRDYLDKLSEVVKTRLCTSPTGNVGERISLMEAEPLAAAVGISCITRRGRTPSGDRGAYFKTDEGVLHVLLSDGMGTGSEAAEQSGCAVRMLERFLRSGIAPETAVRMLNDLLLLRNEDDTVCATVDLVTVDLFTGEAHMFKYGAAPSYLKRGGRVKRLMGESLAAGLGVPPHDAPDHLKTELTPGSAAVIVSDGVACGLDDKWLCDLIAAYTGGSARELSRIIIKAASEKFGGEDDMTVYVVCVTQRE